MELWNFTTTIRTPDRIKGFAKVAKQFEGKKWISGNQIQIDFQIALIQNKLYLEMETNKKFPEKDILTLEEAKEIAKGDTPNLNGYRWKDPPMRGRTSFSPLVEFGIFYLDDDKIIHATHKGNQLIECNITSNQYLEDVLLQSHKPTMKKLIPLIGILQLISKVNKLWQEKGNNPTGIHKREFSLFVPSLLDYSKIDSQAKLLIEFREEYANASTSDKTKCVVKYKKMFADGDILTNWDNPNATDIQKKKVKQFKRRFEEYGRGNTISYFRAAGWIQVRGGGFRIDLNPLRKIENEKILNMSAKPISHISKKAYAEHLAGEEPFEIPWKTKKLLMKKYAFISKIIKNESSKKKIPSQITIKQTEELEKLELYQIEEEIETQQVEFKRIVTTEQIQNSTDIDVLKEIIHNLKNLPSEAALILEYECTRGLMALDDGEIKPNYSLGDDGLPTSTAPGNQGDIESFYPSFNLLTEVTMLTRADQWRNEAQPVTRHYRNFAETRGSSETYCLFIAPALHRDTIDQFHYQNNRPVEKREKIIPITNSQYIEILELLLQLKEKDPSYKFSHESFRKLLDSIIDSVPNFTDELGWRNNMQSIIDNWKQELLSNS